MLGQGIVSTIEQIPSTYPHAPELQIIHADGQLSLSWNEPDDMGNNVTGYNLYRSLVQNNNFNLISNNQPDTQLDDNDLANGVVYYYKVSAINTNGEGLLSEPQNEYPSTVLNAPVITVIDDYNRNSIGGQLEIGFTLDPADISVNGGSVVTLFNIYLDGIVIDTVEPQLGTSNYHYIATGLNNEQLYTITVSAINRDGESILAESASNPIMPTALPSPPNDLTVIHDNLPDGHELFITFGDGDGIGRDIVSYNLYKDGILLTNILVNNPHEYYDGGLTNGQEFSYQISTININGEGMLSDPVVGIPSGIPDIPNGLTLQHGDEQLTVTFILLHINQDGLPPSDEGNAIVYYKIYYSIDNFVNQTVVQINANKNQYVLTDLENGVPVQVKISAVNTNGESILTNSVSATPSTSSDTVRNVTIDSESQKLLISFSTPLNENNDLPSGGLNYKYAVIVTDTSDNEIFNANELTTTLVNVSGLVNEEQYNICVYAYNAIDINYNKYFIDVTVIIPKPSEINDLAEDLNFDEQISLK